MLEAALYMKPAYLKSQHLSTGQAGCFGVGRLSVDLWATVEKESQLDENVCCSLISNSVTILMFVIFLVSLCLLLCFDL